MVGDCQSCLTFGEPCDGLEASCDRERGGGVERETGNQMGMMLRKGVVMDVVYDYKERQ